ncbi:MAG: hypothetical protein WC446_02435 [Candidatus Paceibacterota bacterium]|jgi:hypothetical protein
MDYFQEKYNCQKESFIYSRNRSNEMAESFVKIEIQITSFILAFMGAVFLANNEINTIELFTRECLIVGWISLVLSLFFGLINNHIKQNFWDKITDRLQCIVKEYLLQIESGNPSIECIEKIEENLLKVDSMSSSNWPWAVQTILLFIGFLSITVAFLQWIF